MFYILSSKFQSRHRDFNFYDHRKTDEETDSDTDVMPDLCSANEKMIIERFRFPH